MKNKIYILLSAIVIITILVKCIDNDKPKKLDNIPDNAIWRGGKDGGFWFQIVNYNENAVRFKIYNDYNGELVTDRYFSNTCKGGVDINNINYYDYEKIVMMNGCELLSKNKNTDQTTSKLFHKSLIKQFDSVMCYICDVSTPLFSDSPGFIRGGRTAGGAREFNIPNGPIPKDAIKRTVE